MKYVLPTLGSLALCAGVALAQLPEHDPSKVANCSLKASVGSFKILKRGKVKPSGKITMNFKGTVLLVGASKDCKYSFSGNVRKEYDDASRERIAFHGQGTLTLDGTFTAVQWFGRDLSMNWLGQGVIRVYGEFDSKGETGTITFEGDPKPKYWGSGGMTYVLPPVSLGGDGSKAKVRRSGG